VRCLHLASAAIAAFGLLTGCGSGGGGDQPSTPAASEFGVCPMGDLGPRISNVFGPATWENANDASSAACVYPPYATNGCISGATVSVIDTFDETGDGAIGNYYVQDTADDPNTLPPYSGVTVFGPTFTPPDLRLFPTDVVDVFGTVEEYPGPSAGGFSYCRTLPEVAGTMSFRFDGVQALEPKTIPVEDLHSYDTGRQWLGMLVKIENVSVGPSGVSSGRLTAPISVSAGSQSDIPSVDNELYDVGTMGPDLTTGASFKSITGIVTYFYEFHLAPRSPADFEAE
jgi:hypothetical protein